jgi:hypothetical protein
MRMTKQTQGEGERKLQNLRALATAIAEHAREVTKGGLPHDSAHGIGEYEAIIANHLKARAEDADPHEPFAIEALKGAREALVAFQHEAGIIPGQGFSALMTEGERKAAQAIEAIDSLLTALHSRAEDGGTLRQQIQSVESERERFREWNDKLATSLGKEKAERKAERDTLRQQLAQLASAVGGPDLPACADEIDTLIEMAASHRESTTQLATAVQERDAQFAHNTSLLARIKDLEEDSAFSDNYLEKLSKLLNDSPPGHIQFNLVERVQELQAHLAALQGVADPAKP